MDINLFLTGYIFLCMSLLSCTEERNSTNKFDQLVWADEFDIEGTPDPEKWTYDRGDGCPNLCGWGNRELQYYKDEPGNVRVEKGYLILELHKDSIGNRGFTSGRINTREKADWLYGRFEIRAKLPGTLGTWPAIWMGRTGSRSGSPSIISAMRAMRSAPTR